VNPASSVNSNIKIIPLSRTARNVRRFLNVSYAIYRNDPHWVAPLLMDLKKVFTNSNPLFEHAKWRCGGGARRTGRRTHAGIIDHHHNRVQKDNAVFLRFSSAPMTRRSAANCSRRCLHGRGRAARGGCWGR